MTRDEALENAGRWPLSPGQTIVQTLARELRASLAREAEAYARGVEESAKVCETVASNDKWPASDVAQRCVEKVRALLRASKPAVAECGRHVAGAARPARRERAARGRA